jgi:hypothetical protein
VRVFFKDKLVLSSLEHPQTGLLVQIETRWVEAFLAFSRIAYSDPSASLRVAVVQDVLLIFHKLDLRVPFAEVCRFDVHGQVELIRITRAEKFTVRCCVDIKELSKKYSVGALKNVIVVRVNVSIILLFSLLFKGISVLEEL